MAIRAAILIPSNTSTRSIAFHIRIATSSFNPFGLKLRPSPHQDRKRPRDSQRSTEATRVRGRAADTRRVPQYIEVERYDNGGYEEPRPVEPWPARVRDG